jgi:hypothetical protein
MMSAFEISDPKSSKNIDYFSVLGGEGSQRSGDHTQIKVKSLK